MHCAQTAEDIDTSLYRRSISARCVETIAPCSRWLQFSSYRMSPTVKSTGVGHFTAKYISFIPPLLQFSFHHYCIPLYFYFTQTVLSFQFHSCKLFTFINASHFYGTFPRNASFPFHSRFYFHSIILPSFRFDVVKFTSFLTFMFLSPPHGLSTVFSSQPLTLSLLHCLQLLAHTTLS